MLTGLRKTSTLSPEPLIFWLQLSHSNISKVEMQKLHPPSPSHEVAARWLRLRYTIRPDPHAAGFYIRMTNKHLDGRWRGFWKPHSLPSMVHTLHFILLFIHMQNNSKSLASQNDSMFTLFDNWTSFQCPRQGNLLIQSRYVLWMLKNA